MRSARCTLLAITGLLAGLAFPLTAHAGFEPQITVAASGGNAFGPAPEVGFTRSGAALVQTVGDGKVQVFTRPPGGTFAGGSLGAATRASSAVGAGGAAVVAWVASTGSVRVAYRATDTGALNTAAASFTGATVKTIAAGIDSSGNAVVAWQDGSTIRYVLSTGATFGAAQTAPVALGTTFDGRGGGDLQRDYGPRAYRDDAGNVSLVYRASGAAKIAHLAPGGAWDVAGLPKGSASYSIVSDADPSTQRLIAGYDDGSRFYAFEGSTASTSGTVKVDQPASGNGIYSVAVRPGGAEDTALWQTPGNGLDSASCLDGFTAAHVSASAGAGVVAGMTSGSDQLAYFPGAGGLARAHRSPGGDWVSEPDLLTNNGGYGFGSGYNGEALMTFVEYPTSGGPLRGFPYTGPAAPASRCAGPNADPTATPVPTAQPGARATSAALACSRTAATAFGTDTCTITVADAAGAGATAPAGTVAFSAAGGVFTLGSNCSLSPSGSRTDLASCTVQYVPPTLGTARITATYAGNAQHGPSSAFSGSDTANVRAVCNAFYLGDCVGKLPAPDALEICVSLYQHCTNAGAKAGDKTKPQTIDLSGLPAPTGETVETTMTCGTKPARSLAAAGTVGVSDDAKCSAELYLQSDDPVVAARYKHQLDLKQFGLEVDAAKSTVLLTTLNWCRNVCVAATADGPGSPVTANTVKAFSIEAALLTDLIGDYYDTFKRDGRPVVTGGRLSSNFCNTVADRSACDAFFSDLNEVVADSASRLKERKHQLGLDAPFAAPKTTNHSFLAATGAEAAARVAPLVLAAGHTPIRTGKKAKLRLSFPRKLRAAVHKATRHHHTIRATLVVRVTPVVGGITQTKRYAVRVR